MSDKMSEEERFSSETIMFEMECDVVQRCISRMATTASWVKGYTAVLVTGGLLTVGITHDAKWLLPFVAVVVLFWCLDTYYLWMERMFRKAYNSILEDHDLPDNAIRPRHHSMNPFDYAYSVAPFWRVAVSVSVLPFYGMMLIALAVVALLQLL